MFQFGEGEMLTRQDRTILEAAEILLQPERPDTFDLTSVSRNSGIEFRLIQNRFPFPELLAVGIMVMMWEDKANSAFGEPGYCLNRPNGFQLKASEWEPDPELLRHFSNHPLVKLYLKGEPPLRLWFRKPGKAS